jgi:hypothetical protein
MAAKAPGQTEFDRPLNELPNRSHPAILPR